MSSTVNPPTFRLNLNSNLDRIIVAPPLQRGYGQWLVSRMRDLRAIFSDPGTTVDLVTPKAVQRALRNTGTDPKSTLAILQMYWRNHRQPNDAERRDAIAITKLLQTTLSARYFQEQLAPILQLGGGTIDVMNNLILPILVAWRAEALGIDAALPQILDDGLMAMILEAEKLWDPRSTIIQQVGANVHHNLELLKFSRVQTREIPILHLIGSVFLAVLPIAYTSGLMLIHLAENPQLQDLLSRRHDLRTGYLREVERLMNAFRYVVRQVGSNGLDLGDVRLPPRSLVILDCTAANRDPDVWDHADRLMLERAPVTTASFGFGPLACTGAQLSRQFMANLLDAVLEQACISLPMHSQEDNRMPSQLSMIRGYRYCRLTFVPR